MNDIYQQIWNSDRHKFLVSPRNQDGDWCDPAADILLDEQVQAHGRHDLDLAIKPLFYRVDEIKLNSIPSFVSMIQLLDNYQFDSSKAEIVTKAEKAEIAKFIADILPTEPIKLAQAYITNQLKFEFAAVSFKAELTRIWFDLYTNYFGDVSVRDVSAFEHIFVGEGKYDYYPTIKNTATGAISGYHSWIKFYLDEKNRQVNYLGHNYELQGDVGKDNPYVIAVQMLRSDKNRKDKLSERLFKKKGCFFIGTSPECDIAMATVAYYENIANHQFKGEKRRTKINGANYDLALYRNYRSDGTRGNYIRSFYPIFLGTGQTISEQVVLKK